MYRKLTAVALAASVHGAALAQGAPGVSAFARLPAVVEAEISPNGQGIAILGGGPADRTISFMVIDQPNVNALRLGDVETVSIDWAGDNYAIARIAVWEKVGPRNDYRFERNVAVKPDGKVASYLLMSDGLSQYLVSQPVVGVVTEPKPQVIVRGLTLAAKPEGDINTRFARKGGDGNPLIAALFTVDPSTGRGRQIEKGDFDTEGWDVDLKGEARVMLSVDELNGRVSIRGRPKGSRTWALLRIEGPNEPVFAYLGYSDPEDAAYIRIDTPQGGQIMRYRLAGGAPEPVGAPVADANTWLVWDSQRATPIGVARSGKPVEWSDQDFAAASATLTRAFKGKTVSIVSWSKDRTRMLAQVEGMDTPPTWYLFDRPRKEISPIGEAYPELAGAKLGRTTFLSYKARDGLEIPAYFTLPPGAPESGAKAPLVVLPHGGPSARDDDSFDYLTHFLASRGYAVLRPQYRGSAGFGAAFEKAGNGEWGGKMQTDLLDGVAAMAAGGAVDPARVCIVGHSFGGYAALSGAVFHPEAYRCAASIAGVSDLGLLIGAHGSDYGRTSKSFRALRQQIAGATPDKIEAISPLKNAARAGAPVLLLHGDQDTIVDPLHSTKMSEALTKAGKPVEYVALAGENHYLTKTASRTRILEALDAFLARNLPVARP
ncbi:alpha/beta hydrolase family protein [Phenylobacterium sp. VNQ135]|uniref:alpha/beta hydrolase family protein n=1 Tax=Phenylobacterium sp. VNQ135 TaxID=3400922 RepID=UPI003C0A6B88